MGKKTWFWRLLSIVAFAVCSLNVIILLHSETNNQQNETNGLQSSITFLHDGGTNNDEFSEKESTSKEEHLNRSNEIHEEIKEPKLEINIPEALKKPVWPDMIHVKKFFIPEEVMKVGVSRSEEGFVVFGIPTVKRKQAYYLLDTVKWLVINLSEKEKKEVVIVVFLADYDKKYHQRVMDDINHNFPKDVALGLIHVIRAPSDYYPKMRNLPLLYGDKPSRVYWRSKQAMDYSYLYYYCADLAEYYIQLEDDVMTGAGYLSKIKRFIEKSNKKDVNWSILEFGARGFIGMTYRTKHLKSLARFCRFYFWTMPVDWLFRVFNDIFLYGSKKSDVLRPPIFKHIGEYSSLDGQVRKLEDLRSANKDESVKRIYQSANGNPKAEVTSSIQDYVVPHHLFQAYDKVAGFFWGKNLENDDFLEIIFDTIQTVRRIVISSGSPKYPSDSIENSALYMSERKDCENYQLLENYIDYAVVDYSFKKANSKVFCVKLVLTKIREDDHRRKRWLIVKEIAIL